MKKLPFVLMMVFAVAACGGKKDKAADNGSGSTMAGSSMAGSGSAMAGSGSAMAGSDMAGSAMAGSGSGSAMAGSDGSAAMAGSGGSGAAMAGSGAGSAAMASDFDFDKLTHEEQTDFMKKHVMVTMKPLFQKFDAKHYANFTCKTCHGKDPQKSKFKMPTPDLPKLDFEALKAGKQKPEIAKWMGEVVEPEMAKLLNRPQYDPKAPDPKQFGCLGCHQQKK